jgi:hypothetical protein
MAKEIVQIGDIVKITGMPTWDDCLLLVEEVKGWGVTGMIYGYNNGSYPLRVASNNIAAVWRRIDSNGKE